MGDMSEAGRKAWATRKANQLARQSGAAVALVNAVRSAQSSAAGVKSAVMSEAGKKAWATRIANMQAKGLPLPAPKVVPAETVAVSRAVAEVRQASVPVSAPSDLEVGQPISIWLDESDVGAGLRCAVVKSIGPVKVELFYAPTLQTFTVDRRSFDRYATPLNTTAERTVKRIDLAASIYDRGASSESTRQKLTYSPREVRSVRELVEAYFAKGGEIHKVDRNVRTINEWQWPHVMATGKLPEIAA